MQTCRCKDWTGNRHLVKSIDRAIASFELAENSECYGFIADRTIAFWTCGTCWILWVFGVWMLFKSSEERYHFESQEPIIWWWRLLWRVLCWSALEFWSSFSWQLSTNWHGGYHDICRGSWMSIVFGVVMMIVMSVVMSSVTGVVWDFAGMLETNVRPRARYDQRTFVASVAEATNQW